MNQLTKNFAEEDLDILELREYIVPAAKRLEWMMELNNLDVTRRVLFPDLDGLAAGIANSELLRQQR